MKTIKVLAAVTLLLATSAVSYWCGYHNNDTKNYQAACLFSDAIRLEYDTLDDDEEVQYLSGCCYLQV